MMMTTKLGTPTAKRLAMAIVAVTATALSACGDLQDNTVDVEQVGYTPDGSLVLFTPAGIAITDGTLQKSLNFISTSNLGGPASIATYWYSLSADGTVAAVAYSPNPTVSSAGWGANTRVATYSIPDGTPLNRFDIPDAVLPPYGHGLVNLALSPDGRRIYAATAANGISARMLDTTTGRLDYTMDGWWDYPVWSADGARLFGVDRDPESGQPITLGAVDSNLGSFKWGLPLYETATTTALDISGLALVGDGTTLTAPATDLSMAPCPDGTQCPLAFMSWSTYEGVQTGKVSSPPNTFLVGSNPHGGAGFACNATDTCAIRMSQFNDSNQQLMFERIYKTDGTVLLDHPMGDKDGQGSMAISPDGQFITIADTPGLQGGVSVYNIMDGSLVGTRDFRTQTF
jgi:hypothetical protein